MAGFAAQSTTSWRYRLPIVQVALAVGLLIVAGEQQKRYYGWFFKVHPNAFEIDYAYNPPARLIALLICGPGILVPRGTAPYDPDQHFFQGCSLLFVGVFWFWIGIVVERKSGVPDFSLTAGAMKCLGYALLLAYSAGVLLDTVRRINLQFRWDYPYLHTYGLRARILMDFATIAWFLAVSAICTTGILHAIRGIFIRASQGSC